MPLEIYLADMKIIYIDMKYKNDILRNYEIYENNTFQYIPQL